MTDLPIGWVSTTVANVAETMFDGPFGSSLKTSDYKASGVRVARLENIGHLRFRHELTSFISEEKYQGLLRHTLRSKDVLFSSFVDKETRVCLVPDRLDNTMINKADCFCVRSGAACDPKFLAYQLASPNSFGKFSDSVRGVTRPRIGLRDLAQFQIGLPPLAEQRRIVAKLDALTARTARARADLRRVPTLAARYKQAVLTAAFNGGLTASSRGETALATNCVYEAAGISGRSPSSGDLPDSWGWTSLGAVAAVSGGLTKNAARTAPGLKVPYLRVANVYAGELRLADVSTIGCTDAELAKKKLLPGDVLVVEGNGSLDQVGRAAVWHGEIATCTHQNHLIRLRPSHELDPDYTMLWLSSPDGRAAIEGVASSSSGLHTLSISKLKGLPIPMCELSEQRLVVRRVLQALSEIARLAAEAAAARRLLDRLDQAILAKAFRGELVPQDPADEPAQVLLERIRAERAAAPAKPKRGRKPAVQPI